MDWCQREVCIKCLSRLACHRCPNSVLVDPLATTSGPPSTRTSASLVTTPCSLTESRELGKVSPLYAMGERRRILIGATLRQSVVVVWIFIQFLGEFLDVRRKVMCSNKADDPLMTVDRFGRRKPLIIGPILMAIFLAWQAAIAQKFSNPSYSNQGVGIAGLASIFLFSGAFSASFGPVSWIYQVKQRLPDRTSIPRHSLTLYFETITLSPDNDPLLSTTQSEIFPMNQRAYGTAVSTASNWVSTTCYFS